MRITEKIIDIHSSIFEKDPGVAINNVKTSSPLCSFLQISKILRKSEYTKEEIRLILEEPELGIYSNTERQIFENMINQENKHTRLEDQHHLLDKYRDKLIDEELITDTYEAMYLGEGQFGVATLCIDMLGSRRDDSVLKFIHKGVLHEEFENQKKIGLLLKKNEGYEDKSNRIITKSPQLKYQNKQYCLMEYLHGITVQKILIYNQYQNAIKKQFNQLMEYNSQENKENKFYNAVINKFNLYSRCFLNINIYDFLEIVTIRDLIYLLKEENIEIDFNTHKVFTKPEHFQTAVKVLLNPELNKYQYDYKPEVIQSYIRNTLKKLEKDGFVHPDFNSANNILDMKQDGFSYGMIDFGPLH